MLTTDSKNPLLHEVKANGQNEAYLVLNEEERAKGFVRPVRTDYVHMGINWNKIPHEIRMLDESEKKDELKKYVAVLYHVKGEDGKFAGGRYITENELKDIKKDGYTGGCGVRTKMNQTISETYARNPKFYGATFCVGCGKHLSVSEFVWDGTDEIVGS